jgi:hypothetical protein
LIRIRKESPTPKASFLHQKLGAGIFVVKFFFFAGSPCLSLVFDEEEKRRRKDKKTILIPLVNRK